MQKPFQTDAYLLSGFLGNLIPVTLGNIVGGTLMVGMVYWFIYLRGLSRMSQEDS